MTFTIRILPLLAIATLAPPTGAAERHEYREIIMGVETKIILYCPDEAAARRAARRAFDSIIELDAVLSDYRNDSEVMRLCRAPGEGPVPVSDDLFAILSEAEHLSRFSGGAFDVTVGPLSRLWREARRSGAMPAPEDLRDARRRTGWRKVVLDGPTRTVRLLARDMRIDFGGIGKGYAADRAVEVLTALGCPRCLVSIGGDIAAGAPPPDAPGWRIEVRMAGDDVGSPPLTLAHRAVATSGDTEQFVEIDGVRYSHILDPATGLGLTRRIAVTVSAPRATLADGLASAISVLGPERGLALLDRYPEAAAVIVIEDDTGRHVHTAGAMTAPERAPAHEAAVP
jgi:thiamine biosynthesis lipoprotein